MRGYVRLLEQQGGPMADMQRNAVAGATKAGDRATELLTQLSALARLYRGEVRLDAKAAPLEPLLRAALHDAALPAEPVVTLHVADLPGLTVPADERMLRIAIAALVTALARAQVHDTRIVVSARESSMAPSTDITVDIKPFPSPAATAEEHPLNIVRGGVGFDLPIAAYIIGAHRGRIAEHTAAGRLMAFSVTLPAQSHR
jgi:signal transduction histidine kinase